MFRKKWHFPLQLSSAPLSASRQLPLLPTHLEALTSNVTAASFDGRNGQVVWNDPELRIRRDSKIPYRKGSEELVLWRSIPKCC
jgi:hypothetical protein